jgi:hypothetical protein
MSTQHIKLKKLVPNAVSDKASLNSRHTTSLIHDYYDQKSENNKKPPKHTQRETPQKPQIDKE